MPDRCILFQVAPTYFHDGDPQKMKLVAWAAVFNMETERIDAQFYNGAPAEILAEAMKVFPDLEVRTIDTMGERVRTVWRKYAEDTRAAMDSLLRGW